MDVEDSTCSDVSEVANVMDEQVTWAGEVLTKTSGLVTHVDHYGGADVKFTSLNNYYK